jgi:hypothetical protein
MYRNLFIQRLWYDLYMESKRSFLEIRVSKDSQETPEASNEFQNFATSSFVKILSETRKYRLNLIVANQYIGQLAEEVIKVIFGNAGSLKFQEKDTPCK